MTEQCRTCSALHWKAEAKQGPIPYTICRSKGDGILPPPPEPPQLLRELLQGDTQRSRHFLKFIRGYNNALTFTSCKYQQDTRLQGRAGIQSFTIQGELYHLQGPLHTGAQAIPSFAQLYFYDPAAAATSRLSGCHHPDLWQPLLQDLDDMIRSCGNPFIHMYATAREQIERARALTGPMQIVLNPRLHLVMEAGSDKRRTNLPTALEVAAFIPDEYEGRSFRDIVIAERREDGEEPRFHTINHNNAAYFPLHYVLLFPQGNPGWHWALRLRNDNNTRIIVHYSERAWLRYHLFPVLISTLQYYGLAVYFSNIWWIAMLLLISKLWISIADIKIKSVAICTKASRMLYWLVIAVRIHLGAVQFCHPALVEGIDPWPKIARIHWLIQRHFGKAAAFVTMTANANPNWPELKAAAFDNQSPADRADLMARVFHAKKNALIQDLKDQFGRYLGIVWTIEYQKRGLPHT